MVLSHYTGLPRTMREILPEAAPGKTLEECTAAELIQMIVTRHVERAVYEDNCPGRDRRSRRPLSVRGTSILDRSRVAAPATGRRVTSESRRMT